MKNRQRIKMSTTLTKSRAKRGTHRSPHHAVAVAATMIIALCSAPAHAATAVYFDVAGAPDHASSLSPQYVDNAQYLVTASALLAHGVDPSYASDLGGPGDFIFAGWQVKELPIDWNKYIEFSVTATEEITFSSLKYSFFGGLWSNMGGPRGVIVEASRDGFLSQRTGIREGGWNLQQTTPFVLNCPNDFVDDLSSLGSLSAGQTMSFRFYAVKTDYGSIPGGFWNKSPNDYNPTLEFTNAGGPVRVDHSRTWGNLKGLYR
jgi:hypothetical protein